MIYPNVCCPLINNRSTFRQYGITNRSGCYAAFDQFGICLYVGKSINLFSRIMAHFIDQNDGNGTRWRLSGMTEWYIYKPFVMNKAVIQVYFHQDCDGLEEYLIWKLNPVFNVLTKTGKRKSTTHNQ